MNGSYNSTEQIWESEWEQLFDESDVELPETDGKSVEVEKPKKVKRPRSRNFLKSKRHKSSNSSQSETESGKEEVSVPPHSPSEKDNNTETMATTEENMPVNTTSESGVGSEAEQKEVKGQTDDDEPAKDGQDETDKSDVEVPKEGRTVASKSDGDVEDDEEDEVFPNDAVSESGSRKSQTLPAATSAMIAPMSPTSPTSPTSDKKKKKFHPFKSIRKLFSSRKRKDDEDALPSRQPLSKSTGHLNTSDEEGDSSIGRSKSVSPALLDTHRPISMSEDSVFQTDLSLDDRPAKTDFANELASKLHDRNPKAKGNKSPSNTEQIDIFSESNTRDSGVILEDEKSFSPASTSAGPAVMAKKNVMAKKQSATTDILDFDSIATNKLLVSDAAKHRISIRPHQTRPPRRRHNNRRKATHYPEHTEDISSAKISTSDSLSPPTSLSESFLLPDLSELSLSSDDIDFSPPPGPPVIDNKPPLPSMCPSSPIFEEDTLLSPLFDDVPFPSWDIDEPMPKAKTPEIVNKSKPLTIETENPLKNDPPKTEKVKTPPPVLAKPPKKRPGITNGAMVLPPFLPNFTLRETPKRCGEKPARPSSDDIFAKKVQLKSSGADIITSGMTNGKMSIGSPETKNKQNKSIFGEILERKVEVKPYRSSSASEVYTKNQTEVRLNPSFCVNIAEKKVLVKPRASSLEIPDDKDDKLDANQNKTKSLVFFTDNHKMQSDSTQTDPVDYNLNLTNGLTNGLDPHIINPKYFKSNEDIIKFKPNHGVDIEPVDIFSNEKPVQKRSYSVELPEKEKHPSGGSRAHSVGGTDGSLFSEKIKDERDPIVTDSGILITETLPSVFDTSPESPRTTAHTDAKPHLDVQKRSSKTIETGLQTEGGDVTNGDGDPFPTLIIPACSQLEHSTPSTIPLLDASSSNHLQQPASPNNIDFSLADIEPSADLFDDPIDSVVQPPDDADLPFPELGVFTPVVKKLSNSSSSSHETIPSLPIDIFGEDVPTENKSAKSSKSEGRLSPLQRTPSDGSGKEEKIQLSRKPSKEKAAPPAVIKRKDNKDDESKSDNTVSTSSPNIQKRKEEEDVQKKLLHRISSKEPDLPDVNELSKEKDSEEKDKINKNKSPVKLLVEQKSSAEKVTVKSTSSKTERDTKDKPVIKDVVVSKEEEKENKAPSPIPTQHKSENKEPKDTHINKKSNVKTVDEVSKKEDKTLEKPTTPPKPRKIITRPDSPPANNKSDDDETPDPPLSLKERMAMLRNAAKKEGSANVKPATPAWKRPTPTKTETPKPATKSPKDVFIQVNDAPKSPVENGSKKEVDNNDNRAGVRDLIKQWQHSPAKQTANAQ